jgi:hypothetical protein
MLVNLRNVGKWRKLVGIGQKRKKCTKLISTDWGQNPIKCGKPAKTDKNLLKVLGNGRKWRKLAELVERGKWIKVRQNW